MNSETVSISIFVLLDISLPYFETHIKQKCARAPLWGALEFMAAAFIVI
jgi:hypothetical protein